MTASSKNKIKDLKSRIVFTQTAIDKMNTTLAEHNNAMQIQNSYLNSFVTSQQYLMSEDTRWVDTLLGLAKTIITISVTVAIASFSLDEESDIFQRAFLTKISASIFLVSLLCVIGLVWYRKSIVRPYKRSIEWAHDKMAHILDISSSLALMAELSKDTKKLELELEDIERQTKKETRK